MMMMRLFPNKQVPSVLCSFIVTSVVVGILLSSTVMMMMMMLLPPSTGFVHGWSANNNNYYSLRSTILNRNNNNNSNNNRVGNAIGINTNNRNRNSNSNDGTVSLALVPMDFVDFSSHFSSLISTQYETVMAQPMLTEVTTQTSNNIPLAAAVKEAAKKVVSSSAGIVGGATSTSSDVQAEILTDSSIGLMEYPSFLPDVKTSKLRIKYAQVMGRILIIDISLLPGHTFHPEELAIQLFLLGASMDPIIRSITLFRAITSVRCTTDGCTIDFEDLDDDDNNKDNTGVGIGVGVGGREVECTFINNTINNNNDILSGNNNNNNKSNGLEGTLIIENYEDDESSYL